MPICVNPKCNDYISKKDKAQTKSNFCAKCLNDWIPKRPKALSKKSLEECADEAMKAQRKVVNDANKKEGLDKV